jgi:hypothetical protein
MKNQNPINLTRRENMISKKFVKSSLQKVHRARNNRWNKNSELNQQDDFEPYVYKDHDKQDELDVFRKIKPWNDL